MSEGEAVFRRCSSVRYRVIEGQAVLIVQDRREAVVLNEVGTRILELTDGETSVEAIVSRLMDDYEVERQQLATDVAGHLAELESLGVVEPVDDAPPV